MPENTVYVGRRGQPRRNRIPTPRGNDEGLGKFANPYYEGMFRGYTRAQAIAAFKEWLAGDYAAKVWAGTPPSRDEIVRELRGRNLACWCPEGEPCHADVLLEIANG